MSGPIFGQGQGVAASQWRNAMERVDSEGARGILANFKAVFSAPTSSVARLINAQESFKAYFGQEVERLVATTAVPHEVRAAFTAQADALMREIVSEALGEVTDAAVRRGDNTVRQSALAQALKTANALAGKAIQQLEQQLEVRARIASSGPADIRPQVIERGDGAFTVIRSAPQIENLVLRGGGAKGIGNPPALVEMESAGMLSGLKKVVGTSAGALTATCMACGMSAREFQTLSDSIDIRQMKDAVENFAAKYPSVGTSFVGADAGFALQTLDYQSATTVAEYLRTQLDGGAQQEPLFAQRFEALDVVEQNRLRALRGQDFEGDRTQQMITFNDLRLLHQLAPERFKELVLTGWDNTNKQETYFNATEYPDMPIAVAGRISMSIPIYFASVQFDPGDGRGVRDWTDGGVGSNMPSEAITEGLEGRALEEARARTALMTFDENGTAYTVMHEQQSNSSSGWIKSAMMNRLSGNPDYQAATLADRSKLHDAGPNAFVIFHGDIGTFDLSASPQRVREAQALATLKTLEQIEARQNQACALEVETLEDAVALMSEAEKRAILGGGPPHAATYAQGVADPGYYADSMVYALLESAV